MKPKRSVIVVSFCLFLMVGLSWEVGAFDEVQLKKLKALGSCTSCDLSRANLTGANLTDANLERANLTGANLTDANLERANLDGAKLKGAYLGWANLTDARLTEANLYRADLIGANLTGADLSGASLIGANLTGANLTAIKIDDKAIATNSTLKERKRKKEKAKRLAEEKRKRDEAYRLAEEKRKEKDRLSKEQRILELEKVALNPGFRDLKPGFTRNEIRLMKVCSPELSPDNSATCYDIDNIKFGGTFTSPTAGGVLIILTIDLGRRSGGGFVQVLNEMGDDDPLLNMRGTLGSKYVMDYDWSERDRQLYNAQEKENLYTVYAKGQVALRFHRNRSYVEYREPETAKKFLEDNRPKEAKSSDF